MKKPNKIGVCKLTLKTGKFVKSHIIPQALTRLSEKGEMYVEVGIGHNEIRRPTSWYDDKLVVEFGENILSEIDSVGIQILREHRLIWSSWPKGSTTLSEDDVRLAETEGSRQITILNASDLQLFLLSLVWRSAASMRPEFNDIVLSDTVLEDLRTRILKKDCGRFSDYPVQIFQIITLGIRHNRTPILERKIYEATPSTESFEADVVRLYFDGFVAYVHLPSGMTFPSLYIAACLRPHGPSVIFMHTFEGSRANANISEMAATVYKQSRPLLKNTPISEALKIAFN